MSSLTDSMVKQTEQPGEQVIKQRIEDFNSKIKNYAQKYLNVIERDNKALEEYSNTLKREKMTVAQIKEANLESSYEWRTQIENRHMMLKKDYYREMVTATLIFQSELNELLGQTVELVYVFSDDSNNPVLYTLDTKSLQAALSYERNKKAITGRFREGRNDFNSYLTQLTKYELCEDFNLDFFNYTFKQVIWRYDYGHKKNKANLVLWLNPFSTGTKWLKAQITNSGDIKQAYASVILDRKINGTKLFNDSQLDNNVHSFMEELEKVDNESGLLKGDVTIGKIQYAIKGIAAQTLGIQQVIDLAKKIINDANYSKQDLENQKKEFHEKAKTRNHIQQMGENEIKGWLNEVARIIQAKNSVDMNCLIRFQPNEFLGSEIFK